MKRPWIILCMGLVVAAAAYTALYLGLFAAFRAKPASQLEELAWLQKEFRLSKAEFDRISQLHAAYLPHCRMMCRQIDTVNHRLKQLLSATNRVTPEIEQALTQAAQIRAQCQVMMLNHFYEVSQAMPAEQGRRYLEWMQALTLTPTYHASETNSAPATAHEQHRH